MVKQWKINDYFKDINQGNLAAGVVSGLLAVTGPPALILQAATNGGFTHSQTIMWFFSIYVFGGILGIIMPIYYRMPIVGAHSITGIAFLVTVTAQLPYSELIGAYIVAGLMISFIGYFGIFSKLLAWVPKEIIAAMLAGMITKYLVNFALAITELPLIGGISLLAYLLSSKYSKRMPPMVVAIGTGFILLLLTQPLDGGGVATAFVFPQIQIPQFNVLSILSVSLPLALLILSNDAAVGLGALEQNDFNPPVNKVIFLSGLFTILANFFGGQSANVAGMMSAICSGEDAGPRDKRYMAAIITGIILILFGIFSWKLVPLIQLLPREFISLVLGFALLGVFANSLHTGFSQQSIKVSAAFAFIIAMANITIYNISSPVWSLLIGTIIARYIERQS